jgi:hypothetical protein
LKKEGREMLDGREKREIYGAHVISLVRKGEGKKKKAKEKGERRKKKGERRKANEIGEREERYRLRHIKRIQSIRASHVFDYKFRVTEAIVESYHIPFHPPLVSASNISFHPFIAILVQ